ncbi:MAG: alternative ribosome rescue aminoacyl-tRNA hydrolase ArfB [Aeromicrobium erythreum]
MERVRIPESELTYRFSRSSGPGGQHVNTTDSRVEILWDLDATVVLSPAQKDRARTALSGRLRDGVISVVSSQYRSQHRNREAARVRLEELVARAVVPPRPRRATRPSRSSVRRTQDAKRRRSQLKRDRRPPDA